MNAQTNNSPAPLLILGANGATGRNELSSARMLALMDLLDDTDHDDVEVSLENDTVRIGNARRSLSNARVRY